MNPKWCSGRESACQSRRYQTWVWALGQEDPLEKGMASYSSILASKIPWTEESGGLQSMGPRRVEHDWENTHTHYHIYASSRKLSYKFHTPACFVELHKLILKLMAVKGPRIAQNSIFKGWTQGLRDPWDPCGCWGGVGWWPKRSELFS